MRRCLPSILDDDSEAQLGSSDDMLTLIHDNPKLIQKHFYHNDKKAMYEIFHMILDFKPNVNLQYKAGLTALMFAAEIDDNELVLALLNKGANKTIQDAEGFLAFHRAHANKNVYSMGQLFF